MDDRSRPSRWTKLAGASLGAAAGAALALSTALWADGAAAARAQRDQGPPPAGPPPVSASGQARPQVPTFRAGAALVRVDAYVTRDGTPVTDLTADDVELLEDGRPQTIQTFELVVVRPGGPDATRVEPNTVAASRQAAADPRARVFVIFLDTRHVHMPDAQRMRGPLAAFLDRVVGQDDLVSLMTPDMAASEVTFTRRTASMSALLDQPWTWGQYREIDSTDPVEQNYERCYPAVLTQPFDDQLLGRMVMRRRVKLTLDALRDLVVHLDGLREERKAVLVVSEGWTLFREDRSLFPERPMAGGVFVGPDGRLRTGDPAGELPGLSMRECERDRMLLAQLDTDRDFRTLLDEANRANVSFYPVDPRGLPAVDSAMGPYQPLSPARDAQKLSGHLESLRTLAGATDGQAILGSNDVERGMRRIVDDMSSYYLMSYTSTNSRLDGRFRSIRVRVKRPGVEVRARRGYRAPTVEEVESRAKALAAASVPPTPLSIALGTLSVIRPEALFRVAAATGWRGHRVTDGAVWLTGELDASALRQDDWKAGGEVDVTVAGDGEEQIATATATLAPGARSFLVMMPVDEPGFSPGEYVFRVRVKPASGQGLPVSDTAKVVVAAAPEAAARGALGDPVLFRRGPATGRNYAPTSDPRFRRQERVRIDVPLAGAVTAPEARLLDAKGALLPLPVAVSERADARVTWMSAEIVLAPLAAGDFVIELTARAGDRVETRLVAFRIVP